MIKIEWSSGFKKAYKKQVNKFPDLPITLSEKLNIFIKDPFDARLKTHKLTGKLSDLWSFSLSYDRRVIFHFEDEDTVLLVDIGTHDEVY